MSDDPSGEILPTWLPQSFDGFRNLVLGVLVAWLVGALVGFAESIIASIMAVWGSILWVGGRVGGVLEATASTVATVPIVALGLLEGLVVDLASGVGPAAPLVVVLFLGVGIVVLLVGVRLVVGLSRRLIEVLPFT